MDRIAITKSGDALNLNVDFSGGIVRMMEIWQALGRFERSLQALMLKCYWKLDGLEGLLHPKTEFR